MSYLVKYWLIVGLLLLGQPQIVFTLLGSVWKMACVNIKIRKEGFNVRKGYALVLHYRRSIFGKAKVG